MKVKIFIAMLMSGMLAVSSVYADSDDMDTLASPTDPMQLADNGMSGAAATNNTDDASSNSNGASSGNSANTMSGASTTDDGSPDTATGDDDY